MEKNGREKGVPTFWVPLVFWECFLRNLVGSSIVLFVCFVDGCSAVSCDFGVSVIRGELTSFYSAILSPLHLRNLVSSYYSNLLSSASSPRSLVYVWGLKGADHTCYLVSPPDSEPIQKRNKKPNFVVIHELYCKYSWCLETVACPKPELELPIILPDQCWQTQAEWWGAGWETSLLSWLRERRRWGGDLVCLLAGKSQHGESCSHHSCGLSAMVRSQQEGTFPLSSSPRGLKGWASSSASLGASRSLHYIAKVEGMRWTRMKRNPTLLWIRFHSFISFLLGWLVPWPMNCGLHEKKLLMGKNPWMNHEWKLCVERKWNQANF